MREKMGKTAMIMVLFDCYVLHKTLIRNQDYIALMCFILEVWEKLKTALPFKKCKKKRALIK